MKVKDRLSLAFDSDTRQIKLVPDAKGWTVSDYRSRQSVDLTVGKHRGLGVPVRNTASTECDAIELEHGKLILRLPDFH